MFERLRSIFRGETRSAFTGTLRDPLLAQLLGGVAPTKAGISVSPQTAMQSPAVWGAVRVVAETLGQLPVHLYRRQPDGGRERADDHPVEALLSSAPNTYTTPSEFRMILGTQHALWGNGYAYVNRDTEGVVTELNQLHSSRVVVQCNTATLEPAYLVTDEAGRQQTYDRSQILHIRGVGTSLYQGDSPVMMAREAIGSAIVMEQYASAMFGQGAKPSGALKLPVGKRLTKDQGDQLKASFEQFRGSHGAGKVPVLEDGLDFVAMQLTSADAQFLEMRKFQLQEIARIWRVPLNLLNDLERITYSNAEVLGQQFLTYCILPLLRLWQDSINLTLLAPADRKAGLYAEFTVDDITRADIAGRFTAYSQAVNGGWLNPNEIRGLENRGTYPGGEIFTRPVNSAPVAGATGNNAEIGNDD